MKTKTSDLCLSFLCSYAQIRLCTEVGCSKTGGGPPPPFPRPSPGARVSECKGRCARGIAGADSARAVMPSEVGASPLQRERHLAPLDSLGGPHIRIHLGKSDHLLCAGRHLFPVKRDMPTHPERRGDLDRVPLRTIPTHPAPHPLPPHPLTHLRVNYSPSFPEPLGHHRGRSS